MIKITTQVQGELVGNGAHDRSSRKAVFFVRNKSGRHLQAEGGSKTQAQGSVFLPAPNRDKGISTFSQQIQEAPRAGWGPGEYSTGMICAFRGYGEHGAGAGADMLQHAAH